MSDVPAGAAVPQNPVAQRAVPKNAAFDDAVSRNPVIPGQSTWQASQVGTIYDYIRVAAFTLDPDGRIEQWSDRAEEFFGLSAAKAVGKDPITALMPPDQWQAGHERIAEILDGREWVGLVPYRDANGTEGLAEVYVMPAENGAGGRGASCIAVEARVLRQIETDLASSQAVFGQAPLGFMLFGTDLRLLRVNERFAEIWQRPAAEVRGLDPYDFLSRVEADRLTSALRQVLESGEPVTDMPVVGTLPGRSRRRWMFSLYRLHSGSGRPIGVAALATDVTSRQRAEREAADTRRNLALLNAAGSRIGSSLDLETTARELLDVAVPHFCDLASVDLYQALLRGEEGPVGTTDGSGEVRRVAFASAISDAPVAMSPYDHEAGPVPVGAVHRYPFSSACAGVLRTARTQVLAVDGDSLLGGGLVQSTLVVPIVARDTVLGLVRFARAKGSEPFAERDQLIAEELAARAAVFIDNARLYRREHERALILQRSLLPPGNPEAVGLDIACRYLAGNVETEVGGDWFDVIQLPGHRTALVVGDVMGRGLRAAVAMGELRTAVRTLALLDIEPADVLSALDEVARGLGTPTDSGVDSGSRHAGKERGGSSPDDLSEVYLATCVYAVYDAVTRRVIIANAGHLPPALVEPGEPAMFLDVPEGLPLGVGGEFFEEIEIQLPDGALLALYTDGLVESRNHPLDEGLESLRQALDEPERPLEDVCDHVLARLDTAHGEDDIALLMARVQGIPSGSVGDWTLDADPKSVARARELTREQLSAWGHHELIDTSELLVSELVTNALRHGDGAIRLRLLLDRTLVCEVWDEALAQPRRRRARDTDEGGRGLQLVSLLSQSWGARRTHRGKTVWFELAIPGGEPTREMTVDELLSLF
ncbi:SpoIIE family protein phosphatase [Actinacidiphila oryziradicis]|uniref:PAS domain S-box protein n=1 Tax=Actinacidiphila oryziradicis TaxID=2571141 RepID=A0A4U0SHD2_9ACTN|nr:SpoIIE family protein phosphatase [Actinacidiphila oryziradicis]TKA08936.1 PAS domain S-box protein [Actinacidiphila oryziradicis]